MTKAVGVAGFLIGVVVTTIGGAAFGAHSQADDVAAAAAAAGVEERDLRGALNSQAAHGLTADPWTYLRSNRELPSLPPPVASPAPARGSVWDKLAGCEASGIWSNASNPKYKGGLQMDSTFWARYGGLAFAPAPHLASREQQIVVAQRGLAVQGWQAWPACSRALGLR